MDNITQYIPFPVDVLPEPVGSYIVKGAAAIGCDPVNIALPILSALGSAVGAGYRILLKADWSEPAVIWTATVGESGTFKTPAQKIALESLERREQQGVAEYKDARAQYETEKSQFDCAYDAWRKRGKDRRDELPPTKPLEPTCRRHIVTDTTIEALAVKLAENPRGLLLARDELAGWLNSFTQYKRDSSDAPSWLSIWSAGTVRVDRKLGNTFTFIPRAAVCVAGGIQPGTLRRALKAEYRENGLGARLLLAYPPRQPRRWSEAEIPPAVKHAVDKLFNDLLSIPAKTNESGDIEPIDLPLNNTAKRRFVRFVNEHGQEQYSTTSGELSAVWSKLEAYAARFALIFHFVRLVANDPVFCFNGYGTKPCQS